MAVSNVNYAHEYSNALAQAYPYVLHFGALYNTENTSKYRFINAKTIEIPTINTTGRTAANRDTIAAAARNYDNAWETKTLTNQRCWGTLVHPKDIDQTNMVATISNITKVMNEEHKFPEMDAYLCSTLFTLWKTYMATKSITPNTDAVATGDNVLAVFDKFMLAEDNARVPVQGRILYCTHEVKSKLKAVAKEAGRWDYHTTENTLNRNVESIDGVQVIGVPAELMKTEYNFTEGAVPTTSAKQVNMFLVHPSAVLPVQSYSFVGLSEPSAVTQGKYEYYEEAFEDVFILNKKADALQFNTTA